MADLDRPDLDRIVPLQPAGSRPPLYCVHAVSGSAYAYNGLARLLGADQPVYGFEAPGFDNGRTPVASIPELAAEYTEILREFSLAEHGTDGGYRLLGWSLGGVVSFEMAKLLVEQGVGVSNLILVDSGLPEVIDLPPERDTLHRYLSDIMGHSDDRPPELDAVLRDQPADAEPAAVFDLVERSEILPPEIDAELLADQYAVFRTLLQAFYSVELTGRFEGPATHVLAQASSRNDKDWSALLPQLTEHTVPGTHHTIWSGDNLAVLSEIVDRVLRSQVAPCR
jgi:thioesterase domain-containing protein